MTKRSRRWIIGIGSIGIIALALFLLFDGIVKNRMERVIAEAAGPGYTVRIGSVSTHLFAGTVEVRDMSLSFDTLRTDSLFRGPKKSLIQVEAARLTVTGLSYRDLFRHNTVVVNAVDLERPRIRHFFRPMNDTLAAVEQERNDTARKELPPLIAIDTVRVLRAEGSAHDVSGRHANASIEELDILLGGVVVVPKRADGGISVRMRSATVTARGVAAAVPPIYDLRLERIHLMHPAGIARITGASFVPRVSEMEYGRELEYETDLFDARVDTIRVMGIDVARFLSQQEFHVRRADLHAPVLRIHRDKSMPDGPFVYKRLPASGLRHMGTFVHVDSVLLHNATVAYNERIEAGGDYGRVSFTAMEATMTGFSNAKEFVANGGALQVDATASIQERSRIEVNYSAPLSSVRDEFTVRARLHQLPFSTFNRMTDSLLEVKVNSGRIHWLDMKMRGDNDAADGTLDLHYEDLEVEIRAVNDDGAARWLVNNAAKALVRSTNMPGDKRYRQGTFHVVRRKDRAVFNYLWRGVRFGTLDSMVPGFLSRYAAEKANKKAAAR